MNIRDKPIYLSTDVYRALWLLAKADRTRPKTEMEAMDAGMQRMTPDEIANDILRQAIREQHPQIFEHMKDIDKLENEMIKTLCNTPSQPADFSTP